MNHVQVTAAVSHPKITPPTAAAGFASSSTGDQIRRIALLSTVVVVLAGVKCDSD